MKNKKVKVIPEGLKGDGTYQKEEYGYQMKKHSGRKFRKTKQRHKWRKRSV